MNESRSPFIFLSVSFDGGGNSDYYDAPPITKPMLLLLLLPFICVVYFRCCCCYYFHRRSITAHNSSSSALLLFAERRWVHVPHRSIYLSIYLSNFTLPYDNKTDYSTPLHPADYYDHVMMNE